MYNCRYFLIIDLENRNILRQVKIKNIIKCLTSTNVGQQERPHKICNSVPILYFILSVLYFIPPFFLLRPII